MIKHMKNFDYVRIIENKEECLLFNELNFSSLIIKKEVYNHIQDIRGMIDYDEIAKDFSEEDQVFFKELRNTFVKIGLFEKSGIGTEKFKRINYIITDYCNLLCKHCCYSAKFIDTDKKDHVLNNELKILDRIIDLKPEGITITGGEPLTVKNFDEVMEKLKGSGIQQKVLQTNGTLISEENVKALAECFNFFDISMDGSTEQETEEIRGKGVYPKVIHAIELLKNHNIKNISVSCAMDIEDMEKRRRFEDLCVKLDVKPIIRQMNATGRALKNIENTKDRFEKYFLDMRGEYCNCVAGRTEFSVNCKGDVFPCINFLEKQFSMGSIFDENILEKLGWNKNHEWYQAFSEYVSMGREECGDCEVNILCWSCPFQVKNFMELHHLKSLKAICENKKKAIYRRIWNEE